MQEGAYYSTIEDERMLSAEQMDRERQRNQVYEYLCHLEEAKNWMERTIGEEIQTNSFEEALRDGVYLAKLVKVFMPELVPRIFTDPVLQYRHTDNINAFFSFTRSVGLSYVFLFELVDLYEKKNPPRVIYCIHALAHLLAKKSVAGKLSSLVGTARFSDAEIREKEKEIESAGVKLPSFSTISSAMDGICATEAGGNSSGEVNDLSKGLVSNSLGSSDLVSNSLDGSSISDPLAVTAALVGTSSVEDDTLLLSTHLAKSVTTVQAMMRTLLAGRALAEIKGNVTPTLFGLRYFASLLAGDEERTEALIEDLNRILAGLFAENAAREKTLSGLEHRIALLVKNKIGRPGSAKDIPADRGTYVQYKSLQRLFARLHEDPELIVKAVLSMRPREAEAFCAQKVLGLFGAAKTPREEYAYLRLIEGLVRAKERPGSARPIYLAGAALRALVLSHGLGQVHQLIRDSLLSSLVAGSGCSSTLAEVCLKSLVSIGNDQVPYPVRFLAKCLVTRSESAGLAFSLLWETLFVPLIVSPDLGSGLGLTTERRAELGAICTQAGMLASSSSEWQEAVSRWVLEMGKVQPIAEYYTLQYIESSVMSNLLCLSGDEVNYLLGALGMTKGLPQDIQEFVSACYPLPFKLVFVVPGGLSGRPQESVSAREKRMAKWAILRLIRCCPGKTIAEILQRKATSEEEKEFNELYGGELERYKEETRGLLARLFDRGEIKNVHTCEEVLGLVCRDVVHRVRARVARRREIAATEKAIASLEAARVSIEQRDKTCTEYLAQLLVKVVDSRRVYVAAAQTLLEKGVVCRMYNWQPSQLESIELRMAVEDDGGIRVEVLVQGLAASSDWIRLDVLLLKECLGENEIALDAIGCVFSVPKLIALLNRKFLG
ncbi:Ras GTPase-activating-like protein IQGAP2/3 [Nematocida homosporus]|uniref:Ras GTPase-activating-like protein IQGAP2/3 n=1 Tax=Nematocida homosporus TaxID=1912981 RepID=UPI00222043F0|nr:Ras GTPase-activating-like protein IQGAP2/3 [Nematocida homosporus]KAI5187481.1 Ras GTPase-activating-like protein IQGAP2/3 [Nematocida homosporus]